MSQTEAYNQEQYQFQAEPRPANGTKFRRTEDRDWTANDSEFFNTEKYYHMYERLDTPSTDSSTQKETYFFVDRPTTPKYIPLPPGIDKETQIERYDWHLHDFDLEVEPILSSLVTRTLQQSRIELIEEYESVEWKKARKRFEIRKHAELMKTQRMDAELKRLTGEKARRVLQRRIYYKNRLNAHQKLACRVKAKAIMKRVENGVFSVLKDIGYLNQDPIEDLQMHLVPWLHEETMKVIMNRIDMEEVTERMITKPIQGMLEDHRTFLDKERDRLRKIKEAEEKKEREFKEARKKRRERRALQRLARDKRNFRTSLEQRVINKKKSQQDSLAVSYIDFLDQVEPNTSRIYGGMLLEVWHILSAVRKILNNKFKVEEDEEKEEEPTSGYEEFLYSNNHLRTIFFSLFSHQTLPDHSFRLNLRGEVMELVLGGLEEMKTNLLSFEKRKEQLIEEIMEKQPLHGKVIDMVREADLLDNVLLDKITRLLLQFIFKSTDYKVQAEEEVQEQQDKAPVNPDDKANDKDAPVDLDASLLGNALEVGPADDKTADKIEGSKVSYRSQTKIQQIMPEMKPEDRQMEELKKKIDIRFYVDSDEHEVKPELNPYKIIVVEQQPEYEAIARLRPSLNYEVEPDEENGEPTMNTVDKESREKLLKEKLLKHGRQYLLDEHEEGEKQNKEKEEQTKKETIQKIKDEYIEQYYGDWYDNDRAEFPIFESERPTSLIQNEGRENVLFINIVNNDNLREALESKLKEAIPKEMHLLKDSNLLEVFPFLEKLIEAKMFEDIVKDKDKTPVFDFEV